jgi:hypothetical protein
MCPLTPQTPLLVLALTQLAQREGSGEVVVGVEGAEVEAEIDTSKDLERRNRTVSGHVNLLTLS